MTLNDIRQWLYSGRRPNWIARILNRAWAAIFSSGVAPDYLATLEVTGRKSGRTISLPVVVIILGGQRYLVSMLGNDAQWVQNVRADAGRAVLRSGDRELVQLEEVSAAQRAPILKAYLQRAPGARPYIPVSKDASLAQFQRIATEFPGLPYHVHQGGTVDWITLIKSLFFLFLPPEMEAGLYLGQLHYQQLFYLYGAISLVLGVYLTYSGFTSRSH